MTFDERATARPVHGWAIASAILGVTSLATLALPPLALVLAIAAVWTALASRRALKADAELRGARLSLAGFVTGAGALAVLVVTFGIPIILHIIVGATHGA